MWGGVYPDNVVLVFAGSFFYKSLLLVWRQVWNDLLVAAQTLVCSCKFCRSKIFSYQFIELFADC